MGKVRVLLADDHAVVRSGIRNALQELPDLETVGEVGDGPSLLKALDELQPDLLLIDVTMPATLTPVTIMLQGTPEQVREATLDCMLGGGPRCISAAGCEIPDGTPAENLLAQARALREFGERRRTTS